jgi:type IV secretory pathway VirB4 component
LGWRRNRADDDPAAGQLAARLAPWMHGSFSDLFDGPTTTRPDGHLVVWSLRHLPDELRTIGTLLPLDAIWRSVDAPDPSRLATRRLVVVDEAWLLMRDGEGARFLFRMSKAARKRHAGLTVITQDVADLLGTDLGQAVVANAATQILLKQAPQAIDAIGVRPHRRRTAATPSRPRWQRAADLRHQPDQLRGHRLRHRAPAVRDPPGGPGRTRHRGGSRPMTPRENTLAPTPTPSGAGASFTVAATGPAR